jgi:Protein of unknown function (DUF3830)
MTILDIQAGPFSFAGRLETALAPKTCAWFESQLPYESQFIHVRWSGEGCWIPLGDNHVDLPFENNTSHPAPGHMILYPGGISEAEFLLAYGGVTFSSKVGQLAGNHFLTLIEGLEQLPELGRTALWKGAQPVRFSRR